MHSNQIRYYWQKTSYVIIAFFMLYQILLVMRSFFYSFDVAYWFLMAGGVFVLGFVYSMRVVVDRESLYYSFGVGLLSREIHLGAVARCSIEENSALIAWLYNPGAERILRVHLRQGGSVAIPCDEAKKLSGILQMQ